nr:Alba domain-containing protein [Ipomoea batatas]
MPCLIITTSYASSSPRHVKKEVVALVAPPLQLKKVEGRSSHEVATPPLQSKKVEAIATVVSVAEILKNNGLAVEKKIMTSTVDVKDDSRGRPISKAKIEIVLGKSEKFDEIMAAAASEKDRGDGEVQS